MDWKQIDFAQVRAAAQQAATLFADRQAAGHIRAKGPADFVTEVDTHVQETLRARLAQLAPEVQFMSEEKDNDRLNPTRPYWVLDPVDGTTNLIHGFDHSVLSLALAVEGKPVFGVLVDPYAGHTYWAAKGQGAFCNGQRLQVSEAAELRSCLVITGTSPYRRDLGDQTFARMRALYDHCQDIRNMGTAALELCYVAAGQCDVYHEQTLKPWDYAAGMLLVQEAGGRVTRPDGGTVSLWEGGGILATNGHVHAETLECLDCL